jgi:hypothetical protein
MFIELAIKLERLHGSLLIACIIILMRLPWELLKDVKAVNCKGDVLDETELTK